MSGWRNVGVMGATVVVAGGVGYLIWNHLSKEQETPQTTPAKEAEKATDNFLCLSVLQPETVKPHGTQVLVLGLDGAGKSSLLHSFTNSWSEGEAQPTQGLNAVSINRADLSIEFLEIGGSVELRQYWHKYMPKALMLVFVVDASNTPLFPLVKTLLHDLLVADPHLPLMVLANKQDCAGACTITDLHEALSLSEVGDRKMFVIGTYVTKEVEEPSSGVEDALEFIIQTIQTPR
uniref:ADP-ribosylation factor-like 9 n=1 Tax=Neogobius melanostomus TaxID=47308 RepID=A0A8C6SK47_9GOBI